MGLWGIAPAYATERFPTSVRSVGTGFAYNTGAAVGALMPLMLGAIQDRGIALVHGMALSMVRSGSVAMLFIWMGPETRGTPLAGTQELPMRVMGVERIFRRFPQDFRRRLPYTACSAVANNAARNE